MSTSPPQSQLWGARARDWADVQERVAVPLYTRVLQTLGVRAGDSLLDVGCGAGSFCALAATHGARVAGLDAADALIAIARERVPGGDFRVGAMEALPYPDGAFDVVTGFNSFQFAADPVAALREARRVSRTGTVVMAVFGAPEANESTAYLTALRALLPPPPPGAPGAFAFSADGALESLARQAGMEPRLAESVVSPWVYADEPTALRGLLSSGPAIRAMQAHGEDAVARAVLTAIAPYRTREGGYRLANRFRYVIAEAR